MNGHAGFHRAMLNGKQPLASPNRFDIMLEQLARAAWHRRPWWCLEGVGHPQASGCKRRECKKPCVGLLHGFGKGHPTRRCGQRGLCGCRSFLWHRWGAVVVFARSYMVLTALACMVGGGCLSLDRTRGAVLQAVTQRQNGDVELTLRRAHGCLHGKHVPSVLTPAQAAARGCLLTRIRTPLPVIRVDMHGHSDVVGTVVENSDGVATLTLAALADVLARGPTQAIVVGQAPWRVSLDAAAVEAFIANLHVRAAQTGIGDPGLAYAAAPNHQDASALRALDLSASVGRARARFDRSPTAQVTTARQDPYSPFLCRSCPGSARSRGPIEGGGPKPTNRMADDGGSTK